MTIGGGASEAATTQLIDVGSLATQIDSGTVTAALGGWFGGGASAHYDFNVTFLDAIGNTIDVMPAGEVQLPADPTALVQSVATMAVPAETRSLEVNLTLYSDSDCATCASVAYADSLSVVLSGP